jgi:hypothetical protein
MGLRHGMGMPRVVAELGCGRSIGAGLVFLLAGAEQLIALDERDFLERDMLLPMFDALIDLIRAGAEPNTATNFPTFDPPRLRLVDDVAGLRADLERFVRTGQSDRITYRAPWATSNLPRVDFLFSHAVLQQVRDLDALWRDIASILNHGAFTSHQFDMTSFGTSRFWNGHWAYPDWAWNLGLAESKGLFLNRATMTQHVDAAQRHMKMVEPLSQQRDDGLRRAQFTARWRSMSDLDARTYSGVIIGRT